MPYTHLTTPQWRILKATVRKGTYSPSKREWPAVHTLKLARLITRSNASPKKVVIHPTPMGQKRIKNRYGNALAPRNS